VCVCAICPGLIHNISRVCHCHLLRLVLSSYFCCDFVVVVSMLALVLPYLFLYLPYPEFFLCLYSMPFYTLRLSFCPCPLSFLHSNATCVCVRHSCCPPLFLLVCHRVLQALYIGCLSVRSFVALCTISMLPVVAIERISLRIKGIPYSPTLLCSRLLCASLVALLNCIHAREWRSSSLTSAHQCNRYRRFLF
jgi:hypothetical protein